MKLALIALTLGSVPLFAQQTPAAFTVKSVTHSGQFKMNALADKVFHFFTPAGEREWAEGWDPEFLSPADGNTQEGMVFHTAGTQPMDWVVTHYDSGKYEIAYVTFTSDSLIRQIAITCRTERAVTIATVTYTLTGLSQTGNDLVEKYTAEAHAQRLRDWEMAINHLLKTGNRLAHHIE